jgi:O-Antigen ligase
VVEIADRLHSRGPTLVILTALFAAAILLGPLVSLLHFGARELAILMLVVLTAFLVLIADERVVKAGFFLWILTFAFGWRTLYLTRTLNIHPSEVLIGLLFLLIFARAAIKHTQLDFSLPAFLALFMPFVLLGVVTAYFRHTSTDLILEESKPFVALIPIYYVVKWIVKTREDWERAILLCILVAVYLGGLGLMDYFTPDLSHTLTGNPTIPTLYTDLDYGAGQFARVGFIFYGSFAAGFVIFTFLAFTIYHLLNNPGRNWLKPLVLVGLLFVQVAGIYLSGYRGLWYAMGVFIVAYALVQRRAWLLAGAALLSLPFLPVDFFNRFQSIFNTTYADSSQYDRLFRFQGAVNLIRQSPLVGVGWGGSGYVHSDLTQIGANLGLPAFAVFLAWILLLAWQVIRLTQRKGWIGGYACASFAAIGGVLALLAAEGLIVFIQLLLPVWFVLVMVHKLVDLAKREAVAPISLAGMSAESPNTGG